MAGGAWLLHVRVYVLSHFSGLLIAMPVQFPDLRFVLFFVQIDTLLYSLGNEFRLLPGLPGPLCAKSDFHGLVAGFGGWLRVFFIPAHNIVCVKYEDNLYQVVQCTLLRLNIR